MPRPVARRLVKSLAFGGQAVHAITQQPGAGHRPARRHSPGDDQPDPCRFPGLGGKGMGFMITTIALILDYLGHRTPSTTCERPSAGSKGSGDADGMAPKKTVTSENLVALGPERLAAILVD